MELSKSDIVTALSGRDRGKYFFVIETEGEYVLIADGKNRKLEKPKRKNRRQLRLAARAESRVAAKLRSGDKVLNSDLRRELAVFCQTLPCQNQGGKN
ncbi:MAG: KOW domain-containing RNA-binding protein [Oscillospiraceae bacterium]|nr:KOW domain-containing RNA-binding protein [Oscillospiraceae bacterium]